MSEVSELFHRPEWFERAACRGYADEHGGPARDAVFFSARGQSTKPAVAICADCPVRQDCLDHALAANVKHGIWGGLSTRERKRLRRAANTGQRHLQAVAR
jgi:hypothetical protein